MTGQEVTTLVCLTSRMLPASTSRALEIRMSQCSSIAILEKGMLCSLNQIAPTAHGLEQDKVELGSNDNTERWAKLLVAHP